MTHIKNSSDSTNVMDQRSYYIDSLRVMAMLVVFVFHCSRFFDTIGWHVKDKVQSMGFTVFMHFTHQWTMPLFFLLAGAAAWYSMGNRSTGQFVSARVKRLFLPYLFGIIMMIPPQKYLEAFTQRGFKGNFFEFLGQYFSMDTLWIGPSLRFIGYYGYHLWFLGFLLVFSLAAFPLLKALKKEKAKKFFARKAEFFKKPGFIFLMALPVALAQMVIRPLSNDYLQWADTAYWFIFFLYGYIMAGCPSFVEILVKYRNYALLTAVICFSIMSAWIMLWGGLTQEMHPAFSLADAAYQTLRSLNTLSWLIFFLGAGKKYLNKNSALLSYTNEAVLPFYILHQTVILVIGYYVVSLQIPVMIKFAGILLSSFAAIMALYVIIKRVPATRFIFGMKPRVKIGAKRTTEVVGDSPANSPISLSIHN
ncbi:MAG: acyltransferase family protein [bacterium]|nr:acyltransferase family protein [bacterium]